MTNIDRWPVACCCCLIGLNGRGWLSMSMTHTQPQQPGSSSSSSSNWSPVRSHAAVATASHSEPTPSRTRAWTDPSSAQWAGGQQSTPPVGPLRPLVHLLGGSQSLVPDCGLLGMASARRPRSSLSCQPRRVALIGLALPSRTQLVRLIQTNVVQFKAKWTFLLQRKLNLKIFFLE